MKMKWQLFGKMPVALGKAPALLLVVGDVSAGWAPARVCHQLPRVRAAGNGRLEVLPWNS